MALEKTLRTSIRTVLMSTTATGLRGMTWVYFDHLNTSCLCFVGHEAVQLFKRPPMEAAFGLDVLVVLATSDLGRSANVFQVLEDEGTPRCGVLYNPFGKDVVMVFSLPKPFARKVFQVPFSRLGIFLLQRTSDAKLLTLLLLPASLTKKETFRSHGGVRQSQVNTNHGIGRSSSRFRYGDNDMQRKASLAGTQVSTTRLVPNVLQKVSRNGKVKFYTPVGRRKATPVQVPLDPIRTLRHSG